MIHFFQGNGLKNLTALTSYAAFTPPNAKLQQSLHYEFKIQSHNIIWKV